MEPVQHGRHHQVGMRLVGIQASSQAGVCCTFAIVHSKLLCLPNVLLIFINCLCFTWLEERYVLSSFMTNGLALAFDVALWQRKLEFLLWNGSLLEGSLLQQLILLDFAASVVWVSVQISCEVVSIGLWRMLLLLLTLVLRVSIFVEESIIDVCLPLSLRTLWRAPCLWYQRHVCAISVDGFQLLIRSLLLGDYLRFRLGLDLTIW